MVVVIATCFVREHICDQVVTWRLRVRVLMLIRKSKQNPSISMLKKAHQGRSVRHYYLYVRTSKVLYLNVKFLVV